MTHRPHLRVRLNAELHDHATAIASLLGMRFGEFVEDCIQRRVNELRAIPGVDEMVRDMAAIRVTLTAGKPADE